MNCVELQWPLEIWKKLSMINTLLFQRYNKYSFKKSMDYTFVVKQNVGSEHYVYIMSFVDKDQLEPGCSVLLNHKTHAIVGVLSDDTDPMVSVMKLEKAPTVCF